MLGGAEYYFGLSSDLLVAWALLLSYAEHLPAAKVAKMIPKPLDVCGRGADQACRIQATERHQQTKQQDSHGGIVGDRDGGINHAYGLSYHAICYFPTHHKSLSPVKRNTSVSRMMTFEMSSGRTR